MADDLSSLEFTRAKVVKLIDDLDSGIAKDRANKTMFFHISNFVDDTVSITDISLGDIISGQKEVQKSDGKISLINCSKLNMEQYLLDFFNKYTFFEAESFEDYDIFLDMCKLYSEYLKSADYDEEHLVILKKSIMSSNNISDFETTLLKIDEYLASSRDKDIENFLRLLENLIRMLAETDNVDQAIKDLQGFTKVIFSYIQIF